MPFRLGMAGAAGLDLEAIVAGEVQVLRVEHRLGARHVREDGGLAVVDHHLVGHPAEFFKGPLVAAQEPFLALAQRELDVQPPAVGQHQDKEAQRAARAVNGHRAETPPVHLRTLAGRELQGQERLRAVGPDTPQVVLHDRITAGIALLPQLVPQLHGGERVAVDPAHEGALVRIEFALARSLRAKAAFVALAREPLAHGLHVQVHFQRDLRGGASGRRRLLHLAIAFVADHDATPSTRSGP